MLSTEALNLVEKEKAKYPVERVGSAIMAALRITQEELGYLTPERIEYVAGLVSVPVPRAYEVATFYSMYAHKPQGEHAIKICTNISCMLRGSKEIVTHLENRLGIKMGEVSEDGKFGLHEVECQGACAGAPMFELKKDFYENLTPERVDEILEQLS